MMYFYLNNRPYYIWYGDRQTVMVEFVNFKEDGYDPVEISQEKADTLLAEPPDNNTGEVWELRHIPRK